MIHPRQLAPLCLALTLAAMPLCAQTAATPSSSQPATGKADQATVKPQAPAPDKPAAKSTDAAAGKKSSPFDYHSSEQISEDVPVSFPVDI